MLAFTTFYPDIFNLFAKIPVSSLIAFHLYGKSPATLRKVLHCGKDVWAGRLKPYKALQRSRPKRFTERKE